MRVHACVCMHMCVYERGVYVSGICEWCMCMCVESLAVKHIEWGSLEWLLLEMKVQRENRTLQDEEEK